MQCHHPKVDGLSKIKKQREIIETWKKRIHLNPEQDVLQSPVNCLSTNIIPSDGNTSRKFSFHDIKEKIQTVRIYIIQIFTYFILKSLKY